MHTFYLEPAKWQAPFIITGQEANHMAKALRLKAGEHVRLLDGQGLSGEFAITAVGGSSVKLEQVTLEQHPKPEGRCFLAAAYTKAARRSFMLEKSVELECGGIWFWQAEHSQAKVPADAKTHWQEQLVAGAKQSNNPWIPELRTMPDGAAEVCREAQRFKRRFLLWEDAGAPDMLQFEDIYASADTLFAMGPEGGLSANEVAAFKNAGFKPVSLGRRILRWETAAVFCLGLAWWAQELRLAKTAVNG